MYQFRVGLIAAGVLLVSAVPASADPGPPDPVGAAPVAAAEGAPAAAPAVATSPGAIAPAAFVPPVDVDRVASAPPASSTLEGVTLTISAKDEIQRSVPPLTTAISTREYMVGGVFDGQIDGQIAGSATPPEGVFEVGYQIGCGIDMSTSGGVLIGGAVQGGANADFILPGFVGLPFGPVPVLGVGVGGSGQIGVNLKPGIIFTLPVTKKNYKSAAPEVEVRDFRVKIDGCVGQSFIRSYATLSRSTPQVEDILSWYGVTKAV